MRRGGPEFRERQQGKVGVCCSCVSDWSWRSCFACGWRREGSVGWCVGGLREGKSGQVERKGDVAKRDEYV